MLLPASSAASPHCSPLFLTRGHQSNGIFSLWKPLTANAQSVFRPPSVVFGLNNSTGKVRNASKKSKTRILQNNKLPLKENAELLGETLVQTDSNSDINADPSNGSLNRNRPMTSPSRNAILQACGVTSGLILALGAIARQASHVAFMEGFSVLDSSREVSFSFEAWHIGLIIGLVMLISSFRYILLKTWPDFSESSEAANQQALSSLEPLDYIFVAFLPGISESLWITIFVAFLPGISEELFFRGALLPIFGLDWKSALAIGVVFGFLHLGSGRRFSFAIWATFVGFVYGLATVFSSSIIVAMASHSLNNLIGGIMWRYMTIPQKKQT